MVNFWDQLKQRLAEYEVARDRGLKAYDTRLKRMVAEYNEGIEPTVSPKSGRMHAPYDGYVYIWWEGDTEREGEYLAGQYLPFPKERESMMIGGFTGDCSFKAPLARVEKFIRYWEELVLPMSPPVRISRSRAFEKDGEAYCFFTISKCPQDIMASIEDHLMGDIKRENLERAEVIEKQRAARDAAHESGEDAPEGRVVITGECLTFKWQESLYGNVEKMLVQDDRGFRVWGSVPASLSEAERGDRITFTATVTASDRDAKFGFFKRPTKAAILNEKQAA